MTCTATSRCKTTTANMIKALTVAIEKSANQAYAAAINNANSQLNACTDCCSNAIPGLIIGNKRDTPTRPRIRPAQPTKLRCNPEIASACIKPADCHWLRCCSLNSSRTPIASAASTPACGLSRALKVRTRRARILLALAISSLVLTEPRAIIFWRCMAAR